MLYCRSFFGCCQPTYRILVYLCKGHGHRSWFVQLHTHRYQFRNWLPRNQFRRSDIDIVQLNQRIHHRSDMGMIRIHLYLFRRKHLRIPNYMCIRVMFPLSNRIHHFCMVQLHRMDYCREGPVWKIEMISDQFSIFRRNPKSEWWGLNFLPDSQVCMYKWNCFLLWNLKTEKVR